MDGWMENKPEMRKCRSSSIKARVYAWSLWVYIYFIRGWNGW